GSVSINATTGEYTYSPGADFQSLAAGETTTVSFDVTVTDNDGGSDTETVTVTITGTNDAPTIEAVIPATSFNEDASTTIDLAAAFTDIETADGDLTFSVSGNTNIAVSIVGGVATLSNATADWNGSESITFTVTDAGGLTETQTVIVTVAPVVDIADDNADVVEDTATIINLLGNDGFENISAAVTSVGTASHGSVSLVGGVVTYTPDANYNGADSFTYTVTSGGVTEQATATINVTPVNDAPILSTGQGEVTEDLNLQDSGVLTIVDPDSGESSFQAQTDVAVTYGTFSITSDGSWTYNLDNSNPVVKALETGNTITDSVIVKSFDGTETTVDITINGLSAPINYTGDAAWKMSVSGGSGEGYSFQPKISGSESIDFGPNGSIYWDFVVDLSDPSITGVDTGSFVVNGLDDPELTWSVQLVGETGSAAVYRVFIENTLNVTKSIDNSRTYQFTIDLDSNAGLTTDNTILVSSDEYVKAHSNDSYYDIDESPDLVSLLASFGVTYDELDMNSILTGSNSDDIILGRNGVDIIQGQVGNDALIGGNDNDIVYGGAGDDTLTGNLGDDVFAWSLGETGSDTVTDFGTGTDGSDLDSVVDALDLSDLLVGEENSNDLSAYLNISDSANGVVIEVYSNGTNDGFATPDQLITLSGTSMNDLLTSYSGLDQNLIIEDLIQSGKLVLDQN
ncbi:MAG: hypothetical protein RL336_724, partial [Pseudomonadota bacterium]